MCAPNNTIFKKFRVSTYHFQRDIQELAETEQLNVPETTTYESIVIGPLTIINSERIPGGGALSGQPAYGDELRGIPGSVFVCLFLFNVYYTFSFSLSSPSALIVEIGLK